MKKIVFGGFIFLGGAFMFSIGTLGLAHIEIQAQFMQLPRCLGAVAMIVGIAFGIFGLKNDKDK